ncbi:GNAT family N-acetyltransferase [Nocardiopsis ansamitocini]|uniref:GNAT family N-acetyltransferase n=1 Tax=Nocardiopsis ansamitocini TaxID=1670832 RepID=UPI00255462F3|nr:GNAT family protein [Nocardiopsis ansamitocini]
MERAAFTRSDPSDREAFDAHYRKVRAEPTNLIRVIKQSGVPVGMISSFWIEGDREVSCWIAPERGEQGIAGVALTGFLRIEQTHPVYGRVAETDPGSRSVLEKNGFMQIGQEISLATGLVHDVTEYSYRLTNAWTSAFSRRVSTPTTQRNNAGCWSRSDGRATYPCNRPLVTAAACVCPR